MHNGALNGMSIILTMTIMLLQALSVAQGVCPIALSSAGQTMIKNYSRQPNKIMAYLTFHQ